MQNLIELMRLYRAVIGNVWLYVLKVFCKTQQFTRAYLGYPRYIPEKTCNKTPVPALHNTFVPWVPPCFWVEAFFHHTLINTRC